MVKQKKDRNLKLIDGKWYVDFTFNKKRIRKFGGYTKEQARNTLTKSRMKELNKKMGFEDPQDRAEISFEQFSKEFMDLHSKQHKKSWKRDEESLKHLRPFLKGKTLQDIGPELIENYKVKRVTNVSKATVNRETALLKTIFNKAVEWGKLDTNKLIKVKKFKEDQRKMRILNDEEMILLIDSALPHLKPIVILASNTAMRRNEILSLRWENVDFKNGIIHVKASKSGDREVPMNHKVFDILKELPKHFEYVFPNPQTGSHITDVKNSFKTACRNANITGLRFHDLRHCAATRMIQAGVNLVDVSRILGHSSILMTMRYAHSTTRSMRDAVEKLGRTYDQARQKVDSPSVEVEIKRPSSHSFYDN